MRTYNYQDLFSFLPSFLPFSTIFKSLVLGVVFCALVATKAQADFRCPNSGKIVKIGMSMYEVKLACGEPSFRAIGGNVIGNLTANTGTLGREQWTYDFGASSFLQFFNFDGGALRSVNKGEQYGSVRSQKRQR